MPTRIDPANIVRARKLRRAMTNGERKLWSELRNFRRWYGIHVRRQAPIGRYIADFIMHEHKLVVEVDGEFHMEKRLTLDGQRDQWLAGEGYRVLRFSTGEIDESFDGCVEEILHHLGLMRSALHAPTPSPSPQGGGGSG